MLRITGNAIPYEKIQTVSSPEELCALQRQVQQVFVSDEVLAYIVALCEATRRHPDLRLGASPRASRALYRIGKAYAALDGRDYVTPDDIRALAQSVICHRLMLAPGALMSGKTTEAVLEEILAAVPVPPQGEELLAKASHA